jgi:hypothetical protein
MKTLEQIIEKERENRHEDGIFGIKACKESIKCEVNYRTKKEIVNRELNGYTILFDLLAEYLERAQNDVFFNNAMILACWELINGIE